MPGKYPTDPALIAALVALRNDQGLTNKRLAALLGIHGVTETFLSKYINDNLDREVPEFEAVAIDIIRSIRERMSFASSIYQTSVVRKMGNVLHLIRKTGDIAALTSPAGNGKTSAIRHFAAENPSTICINLNATTRDAAKVEGLIFRTTDHREWKGQTSRYDFPVALIGNLEMIDAIRANDQQFSRVGIHGTYELEAAELHAAAMHVARQFSDDLTAETIGDLTAFIAAKDGRLRAVKKTVILAQQLRAESTKLRDDPRAAIRAAHARLIRDYSLPIE